MIGLWLYYYYYYYYYYIFLFIFYIFFICVLCVRFHDNNNNNNNNTVIVPSPSRTPSWLDMPAPPTHSLKRSITLGGTRSGHHPRRRCHAQTVSLGQAGHSARSNYSGIWPGHLWASGQFPAAAAPHSYGDWLHALPITSCGLRVLMINPFAWQWVCGWGATFAFVFLALSLMPVARMPSFANGRLAESPDIRLWTTSSQGHLHPLGSQSLRSPSGWQGKMASYRTAWGGAENARVEKYGKPKVPVI